ncbi:hypothetical protein GE300_00300 [Rhodobacteraceae bacterium 2CG4]|uniref:Uncharacterized protein n=1 Tax=Halovulum marinum TaxID=2662447 RepID=A0A6L5YUP1_9RHOB|nr:hypothetical protein [Halovulum marinum]MSU88053.1 hypothetical protein [Halovulum marinum]
MERRTRFAAVFVTIAAAVFAAPSVSQDIAAAPNVGALANGPALGSPAAGEPTALTVVPPSDRPATTFAGAGAGLPKVAPDLGRHRGPFAAGAPLPVAMVTGPPPMPGTAEGAERTLWR